MNSGHYEVIRDRWFCTRRTVVRLMLTRDSRNGITEYWYFRGERMFDDARCCPIYGRLRLSAHAAGGTGLRASWASDDAQVIPERYPISCFGYACNRLRSSRLGFVESSDDPMRYPFRQLRRAYLDWCSWRNRLSDAGRSAVRDMCFRCSRMPGAGNVRAWGWYGINRRAALPPEWLVRHTPNFDAAFRDEALCAAEGPFACRAPKKSVSKKEE